MANLPSNNSPDHKDHPDPTRTPAQAESSYFLNLAPIESARKTLQPLPLPRHQALGEPPSIPNPRPRPPPLPLLQIHGSSHPFPFPRSETLSNATTDRSAATSSPFLPNSGLRRLTSPNEGSYKHYVNTAPSTSLIGPSGGYQQIRPSANAPGLRSPYQGRDVSPPPAYSNVPKDSPTSQKLDHISNSSTSHYYSALSSSTHELDAPGFPEDSVNRPPLQSETPFPGKGAWTHMELKTAHYHMNLHRMRNLTLHLIFEGIKQQTKTHRVGWNRSFEEFHFWVHYHQRLGDEPFRKLDEWSS